MFHGFQLPELVELKPVLNRLLKTDGVYSVVRGRGFRGAALATSFQVWHVNCRLCVEGCCYIVLRLHHVCHVSDEVYFFQIYLSEPVSDGYKLLARAGNAVQEVMTHPVISPTLLLTCCSHFQSVANILGCGSSCTGTCRFWCKRR